MVKETKLKIKQAGVSYIRIALNLPLDQLFTYEVSPEFKGEIEIGKRVLVPFRNRKKVGVVIEITKEKLPQKNIREIIQVIDEIPVFNQTLLKLAHWIKDYYFCSLGQILYTFYPFPYPLKLVDGGSKSLLSFYSEKRKSEKIKDKEDHSILFLKKSDAKSSIGFCLDRIKDCQEQGKQVAWIVPEVNQIFPLKEILKKEYSGEIVTFYSKLSGRQRYNRWSKMRWGEVGLALGTRSLVFTPFPLLGLLILEDEENPAYKQKEVPRYNAREIVTKRGEVEGFPVILTSQSPSLESWFKINQGQWPGLFWEKKSKIPRISVIDLRQEKRQMLSELLKRKISSCLQKNQVTLLFLKHRGYAKFLLCRDCGEVIRCPNCNIGLTFHLKNLLRCHYCNYQINVPQYCPTCGGRRLSPMGTGTQRLEREVRRQFPGIVIQRIDSDKEKEIFPVSQWVEKLRRKEINILIGTQLAIKEEILPWISLTGVVLMDSLLNLADFRATERAFQLLIRISRGMNKESELIIQTFNPTHYILRGLGEKQEQFYLQETQIRKELNYPPFIHWERILWEGKNSEKVNQVGEEIERRLREIKTEFLGPSPCPFPKLRGKYRSQLMLKIEDPAGENKILRQKIGSLLSSFSNLRVTIDVDPLNML